MNKKASRTKLDMTHRPIMKLVVLFAIPLVILGIVLTPVILKLMQVPADTWDLAITYIRIVFLGLLGNMGYNMNAGILRGLGDSTASLVFLVISTLTNIVLDTLFIAVFKMDVAGAALATVIAMYLFTFGMTAALTFYRSKRWKEGIELAKKQENETTRERKVGTAHGKYRNTCGQAL